MRKIKLLFLVLTLVVGLSSLGFAATEEIIDVRAEVPDSTPEITVLVKELTSAGQDPFTGLDVQTMNFGTLTHLLADNSEAGVWYSQKYYAVIIFANSFGEQYEIKSSSNGLAVGGNTLPVNSFVLTPDYADEDEFSAGNPQGAQPATSLLGPVGSAATIDALVYRSEVAGTSRIIRAFYSLPALGAGGAVPFTGFESIPLSQAQGIYTGTVTISITGI